jgi:uncharacterized protein (DUF362 family)/NAD-dependent dihydropyrimidine dehydrogenase PreA subunit
VNRTIVSIVHCQDYEERHVRESLKTCLHHVGGMDAYVKPGDTVLIKVNLLSPKSPEKAVTTHPALVKAVLEAVLECGGVPQVGDSSGGMMKGHSSTARAMEVSGIQHAVESMGVKVVNFDQDGVVRVENPGNEQVDHFLMARITQEADVIINLPKLKTHSATLFTGAVKNMFGTIPGYQKAEYHRTAPKLTDFARILVDIYLKAKPQLNIMDAVLAMEGNGPAHGHPRMTQMLMASTDGVALDAVASSIIGFDPMKIDTTRIAHEMGAGEGDLQNITIEGLALSEVNLDNFMLPSNAILTKIPPFWVKRGLGFLSARPFVVKERCTRCGFCAENCPVQAISFGEGYPEINHEKCILCYCCQELCPQGAVIIRHRSPLLRAWLRLKKGNK